jgi:hypothetical protein
MTNKLQLCRIIYYSLAALHVSSDIFAIIRSVKTVFIASGITHVCCCRLVSWDSCIAVPTVPWYKPAATYVISDAVNSLDSPDEERKYLSKHVQQLRNNKLSYTVAYCWSSSSSSSYICHGTGPIVDPFRSHESRSLFKGLPWFLLPVGE